MVCKYVSAFAQTTTHTSNIIYTNIILMVDNHTIPKGKMHSNCRLLPNHIVCKITQRNNIRGANPYVPALKRGDDFRHTKHKQNLWKEHLDAHWDHRHILWKTTHGLSNRAPPSTLNTFITCNNTKTYCDLFHQTIQKHCQTRNNKVKITTHRVLTN